MKCAMLVTGNGPIVILTSYDSLENPDLLERLKDRGIPKFLAYEIPLELARERYISSTSSHYERPATSLMLLFCIGRID
jgi:hypothetical protein